MTFSDLIRSQDGYAVLSSLFLLDKAKQSAALELFLFRASPTIASADNAALDITDAEMEKCIGVIAIPAANYFTSAAGSSICVVQNINLNINALNGKDIFALLVSKATPTYGAANALSLSLSVSQA